MATSQLSEVMHQLRSSVLLQDEADLTDGQLLERFVRRRDEAAFAALVCRHSPMVLGVCRRVLGNLHDAEDALQATFLVLVRKAASVVPRELVANWLYGVAYQTALRVKVANARRRAREKQVTAMPEPEAAPPDPWPDLRPLLDQELSRLPDKYRVPILLCDLEGKTHQEAARQLGWPVGTLSGRLARGRKRLADRLARRGFLVLSAGSLAAVLSQNTASATPSSPLLTETVRAAGAFAAGHAAATGIIPTQVAGLAEGVLKAMFLNKLKAAGLLLAVVFLAAGIGATGVTYQMQAAEQTEAGKGPPAEDKKPLGGAGEEGKKINPADLGQLDERKLIRISARAAGRIEEIYKSTGERVNKGEALAELSSPEVVTAAQELLTARRSGNAALQRVARERLRLWGMDDDQIDAVLKAGKLDKLRLTIRSPLDGYVIRTYVVAGAYVKTGDPLYDVAELSAVEAARATGANVQSLLKERLATLKDLAKAVEADYRTGNATFEQVAHAQRSLFEAELELCESAKERLAIHERMLMLAKETEKVVDALFRTAKAKQSDVLRAKANRLEAEIALERAKAHVTQPKEP
jgi:RNA polymerase sigma factor (sigma-70 family)